MSTWREWIAEARTRGAWHYADAITVLRAQSCLVGETAASIGTTYIYLARDDVISDLEREAMALIHTGRRDGFDRVEDILDAMQDRALQLKAGLTTKEEER